MDTSIALRIDGNARQWDGNNSPQGDRQNRRRQKLQTLLQSLKAGDLDAARQAFTALVNFDPSVSSEPHLSKIGAALQSSNLYAAQHFGQEIQNRSVQLPQPSPLLLNAGSKRKRVQDSKKRPYLSALLLCVDSWILSRLRQVLIA